MSFKYFDESNVKVELIRPKPVTPPPAEVVIRLPWDHAKALLKYLGEQPCGDNDVNYAFWRALNSVIGKVKE